MSQEHRGVWIFAEQQRGRLSRVGPELLVSGRRLADELEAELAAVLLGDGVGSSAQELIWHGADRVYLVESPLLRQYLTAPYCSAMKELIFEHKPEVLLFGTTAIAKDLAPRIACALNIGLTAHCVDLKVDKSTRQLQQICPYFDYMAINNCDTRPQMAMVHPGIARPSPRDEARKGEVVRVSPQISPPDIELIGTEELRGENGPKLEEADRIVGVGRGVKDFRLVQELADELGAMIGGTQALVDDGLISESQLIGVTGITVAPKLYVACGISGASQHTIGMQESEVVVAVNTDRNAPIFKIADFGIVGDVQTIIPLLTRYLEEAGK